MFVVLNKKLLWVILVWFAVLQTVAPFIHGHMGVDTPAQGHGLHMHVQDVAQNNILQSSVKAHTLQGANINTHAIGVDNGVLKNIDLLTSPLFAVLCVLFLFGAAIKCFKPSFKLPPYLHLHLRPQSTPRAPPTL